MCIKRGTWAIARTRPEVPTQGPFARLQQVDDDESKVSPLDSLAATAASQSPALFTMAQDKPGLLSWAVPVRVGKESSTATQPRVAKAEGEGEEFNVYPQVTPALAYENITRGPKDTDDTSSGKSGSSSGASP
jgi:hypothetical protein